LPNLVNEFTRSLDPLKLYEYLAAGKPVVATPTGATAELAEFVALAATGHDLVVAADRALRDDAPRLREARREAVRAATWDERAERIERLLRVADTFGQG
jgi:glycosyltransferase involved in cell wall biosynthesis